ncbi:hypothetical protein RB200_28390 [Streptomyces sp. PmtG]
MDRVLPATAASECDTGKYVVTVRRHDILTGLIYFKTGSKAFPTRAPSVAYTPCDRNSFAQEAWVTLV